MVHTRTLYAISLVAAFALMTTGSAQAAINVANTNDSGPGSLRQAISDAPPGETITVPAGTYTLTSDELTIEKSLTISGNSASDTIVRSGGAVPRLRRRRDRKQRDDQRRHDPRRP